MTNRHTAFVTAHGTHRGIDWTITRHGDRFHAWLEPGRFHGLWPTQESARVALEYAADAWKGAGSQQCLRSGRRS